MVIFRKISAIVCVVVMAVMIPVSVLSVWAQGQLFNEQRFVQTFAPLVADPEVQLVITAEVSRVIIETADIDAVAGQAFEGLAELGLSEQVVTALGLLQGPAAEGMRSLVYAGTERFVTSPAFASVWEVALEVSHAALLQAATQHSFASSVVTTSSAGEVAIQLSPIVNAVTAELELRGYTFASNLGEVDAEIVVAQSDVLPLLGAVYGVADGVGTWVPLLSVVLAVLAIVLSLHRRATTLQVLIVSAAMAIALLIVCAVMVAVVPGSVTSQAEMAAAIAAVLHQVLGGIRVASWWILALASLGIVAVLLLWRPRKGLANQNLLSP